MQGTVGASAAERGERPSSTRTTLRLLGGFELVGGAGVVELALCEQRVLAFLALHPRSQLREYVAGSLWFTDDAHAYASLRSAVWKLRQCVLLPIEASKTDLRLASHVDVDVYRQTVYAERRLGSAEAEPLVDEASALEGDLLPGWYDEWVLFERESLRQQRLHALELLSEALMQRGRCGEAVRVAMSAVRADPLRESPHRLLVGIHLAEGNAMEARRHVIRYRDYLRRHGGIEPSEAFTALAHRLSVN